MLNRRDLIKHLSSLPLVGSFLGGTTLNPLATSLPARNLAKELGIRTFINAAGTSCSTRTFTHVRGLPTAV